jgi:hypothetical protein
MPWTLDPVLVVSLRLALALLLAGAAAHKLRDRARFRAALRAYGLVPEVLMGQAAGGIVAGELGVAVALIVAPCRVALPALAAAFLLLLYAVAIVVNLLRGRRDIDCGCGVDGRSRPLGWWLVGRNLALLGAALAAALPPATRAWTWIDVVTVGGSIATLSLLYNAAELAAASAARWRTARSSVSQALLR